MDKLAEGDVPLDDEVARSTEADHDAVRRTQIVDGRGRVGKTVLANVMVQFFREHGANLRVWNADRQNETHSLSIFHADATRPPANDPEEKRLWLEACFDEQARNRFDSVLDLAGGDPIVRQLASEARLIRTLERRHIKPVSWQVLGPELADLDYLKLSMEGGLFMPQATVLVLNSGLVRSGRSVKSAFAEVLANKVFNEAIEQGAKLAWFPALTCMSSVSDRGLTFAEAKRGVGKPGQELLSFFDQARVEIFWEDHVPQFFAGIPADWLPSMPGLAESERRGGDR